MALFLTSVDAVAVVVDVDAADVIAAVVDVAAADVVAVVVVSDVVVFVFIVGVCCCLGVVVLFLRSILIEVIITFINRSRLLIPDDMHLMSCKNV